MQIMSLWQNTVASEGYILNKTTPPVFIVNTSCIRIYEKPEEWFFKISVFFENILLIKNKHFLNPPASISRNCSRKQYFNFIKDLFMKTKKILLAILGIGIVAAGIVYAADHADTPAVTGKSTDITDVYAFQGQNTSNMVFAINTQGLLSPGATAAAAFDNNTMIELNIDNNADNIEDLVVQCVFKNGTMYVYGPVKPSATGSKSIVEGSATVTVGVTPYGASPVIATQNSFMAFAGPRDDPFFFDLDQFKKILGGTATSFNNPGNDAFKGTNVMSIVLEFPKSLLGATSGKVNVWAEAKRKI